MLKPHHDQDPEIYRYVPPLTPEQQRIWFWIGVVMMVLLIIVALWEVHTQITNPFTNKP